MSVRARGAHDGQDVVRNGGGPMFLRTVQLDDVELYVRMRCDPVMMAELGGPQPREGIPAKVERDVRQATSDIEWITMVVPDDTRPDVVAGTVALWSHDDHGKTISEIGWMILPEFQGRGLAKQAVRLLLERARDDGRWGPVHAFPAVTNAPSNGICRSVGFTLVGQWDGEFAGLPIRSNHWTIDPATDLDRP